MRASCELMSGLSFKEIADFSKERIDCVGGWSKSRTGTRYLGRVLRKGMPS